MKRAFVLENHPVRQDLSQELWRLDKPTCHGLCLAHLAQELPALHYNVLFFPSKATVPCTWSTIPFSVKIKVILFGLKQ